MPAVSLYIKVLMNMQASMGKPVKRIASYYESGGREFESFPVRHLNQ